MTWNPEDLIEKQRRTAWSVAAELSFVTKEDPVLIYNRLMKKISNKNCTQLNNKVKD